MDNSPTWQPHPGPQTDVLERTEFELGFGGSRGGGKTEAGQAWLLYDIEHPRYRALVIRKNALDLNDWLDRAEFFYASLGAKRKGHDIYFPKGAIIRTGHLKDDNAYGKYQGHEYHRMLIEELTQIPTEVNYLKLLASCRSTISELKPQVFSSFNPDGPGFFWVRKRFNIVGIPTKAIVTIDPVTGLDRVFVPSRLSDNPTLATDPKYRSFLDGLPDGLRQAWRDGSWNDPIIEGAYYTKEIVQARAEGRIKLVPYDPMLKVHTIWDLGISDSMTILFVQRTAIDTRVIDCYQNEGFGLDHYHAELQLRQTQKKYIYGKHYAPHDANKRELGTGKTVIATAKDMGLEFELIESISINEGILRVRLMWPRLYINEVLCEQALNAFLNYKKKWNENLLKFSDEPVHDWSSHFADTLRYLAMVEDKLTNVDEEDDYVQPAYEAPGISNTQSAQSNPQPPKFAPRGNRVNMSRGKDDYQSNVPWEKGGM